MHVRIVDFLAFLPECIQRHDLSLLVFKFKFTLMNTSKHGSVHISGTMLCFDVYKYLYLHSVIFYGRIYLAIDLSFLWIMSLQKIYI